MNNFTKEEVTAAKATRDSIIKENVQELSAIYMAGEICMWDEMQHTIRKMEESERRNTPMEGPGSVDE